MAETQVCPKCERVSPFSARVCDCGYNFITRLQRQEGPLPERPTEVTVIAWLLIVGSCIDCTFTQSLGGGPVMPHVLPIQKLMVLAGTTVRIFCGAALLNRQGWARHLYVAWTVAMSIAAARGGAFRQPAGIASLVVFLAFAALLYTRSAERYFKGSDTAPEAPKP